jgi:UDP-2,3-diacylglucosamine hydrolase
MTTLFIADLHLSNDQPAITAGFLAFLKEEAIHADALYILGDLFEAWIGDDDPNSLHATVADALSELHQHQVPCYFIHGNRDFLIGEEFAKRSRIQLLPQEKKIDVYGYPVLILHGDTLCTDDLQYQKFRKKVHNPLLRKVFLWLPLSLRQRIARRLRRQSSNANQYKSLAIMDVNDRAVMDAFHRHQVSCMIHGHTHRPAIHEICENNQTYYRMVLGAWHERGSVIRFKPDVQFELADFPLPEQ